MMAVHGFRRTAADRVILLVDDVEKGILSALLEQLLEFVAPAVEDEDPLVALVGLDPEAKPSDDPAMARLFPDAFRDDPEASGEFRRFTERSLRDLKGAQARTALQTLQRSGSKVTLSLDEAGSWLGALNDLRLTLGTRLEITEDGMEELASLPDDDPRAPTFHVYDWLTFLQESLVLAVMP
jgi:hypothetical protein